MMNALHLGAYSDASVNIQEFMIAPHDVETRRKVLRMGAETFHSRKAVVTAVEDEGDSNSNQKAQKDSGEASERAGYGPTKILPLRWMLPFQQ
jgi:enolase